MRSYKTLAILAQVLLVAFLLVFAGTQDVSAQTLPPTAPCSLDDIDQDDDNLIDICDLEGLDAIRHQLDGTGYRTTAGATVITTGCPSTCTGFELMRSLDFTADDSYRTTSNKATYTVTTSTAAGWQPIGSSSDAFKAMFNGNGHTISNLMINQSNINAALMINQSNMNAAGLFGYAEDSGINNLGLLNVNIIGLTRVGSLVGRNRGSITNSYATGSVSGNNTGSDNHVGGLVGINGSNRDNTSIGRITDSYATCVVSGSGVNVGGLAGVNGGTIANSYATGNVNGRNDDVGGLVGTNQSGASITSSYATGNVEHGNNNVGGLVGDNDGAIRRSYATGDVDGEVDYVGGLVGHNSGIIRRSYAIGDVYSIRGNDVGGLAGHNTALGNANGRITNSYATGFVSTGRDDVNKAGLVAANQSGATITNSYATGGADNTLDGLVAINSGTITNSYAIGSLGTSVPVEVQRTAEELRSPTEPGTTTSTDVYYNWDADVWDFGTSLQFPILKASDGDALLPSQGVGLRNLQASTIGAELRPAFGGATTHHTIAIPPGTSGINLTLTAYNPTATIELVNEGGATDYFAGMGSSGSVSVPVASTPVLIITLREPNLNPIFYRVMLTPVPPCTLSIFNNDDGGINQTINIDKDGNGLIEICYLEDLNAIRHQSNGAGYRVGAGAALITAGCPTSGCIGYELTRSLDFMDDASYRTPANKSIYTAADYWEPIGSSSDTFRAMFNGNGHTISNLMLSRSDSDGVGLFGHTGTRAEITNLGLLGMNITGNDDVGGLVGNNKGSIEDSYAVGFVSGAGRVGGLVGFNDDATITRSYATGEVEGTGNTIGGLSGSNSGDIDDSYVISSVSGSDSSSNVGGLVGRNGRGSSIMNSYAVISSLSGSSRVGGLAGVDLGSISRSYWLNETGSSINSIGSDRQPSYTAIQTAMALKLPTAATGIYSGWRTSVWDFGTSDQFPILKTADGNLLPSQGVGLRELRVLTLDTELSPIFTDFTTRYAITFFSVSDTTASIVLELTAYDTTATIKIVEEGENTDYFAGRGSSGQSDPIIVDGNTVLDITVSEATTDTTYTIVVMSQQITLPPCTVSLDFADDNDGISSGLDIDKDNNRLIEICDLEGLDEIRYQADGTGYRASANAAVVTLGCPVAGCNGFELTKNLDFTADASYRNVSNKATYTVADYNDSNDVGWQPIGYHQSETDENPFRARFDGSGYTISNLMINRRDTSGVGLFGYTERIGTEISRLGLLNVNINTTATSEVGSLVGWNSQESSIGNSYATGTVIGTDHVGGLVGRNSNASSIADSYAMVDVTGTGNSIGGLVGLNFLNSFVINSYATGAVGGSMQVQAV